MYLYYGLIHHLYLSFCVADLYNLIIVLIYQDSNLILLTLISYSKITILKVQTYKKRHGEVIYHNLAHNSGQFESQDVEVSVLDMH